VEDITGHHRRKQETMTNHAQALEVIENHRDGTIAAIAAIDTGIAELSVKREQHVALAQQLDEILAITRQMDEGNAVGAWYKVTTADNIVREVHAQSEDDARRLVKLALPDLGIIKVKL
jgi:Asp-tRNA(Asn)/Glu-tRNA(Gln) amidotransferase C subunit